MVNKNTSKKYLYKIFDDVLTLIACQSGDNVTFLTCR